VSVENDGSRSVVAIFEDAAAARHAMARLEANGIASEAIRTPHEDAAHIARAAAQQAAGGVPDDSGGFLSWLFGKGNDPQRAMRYAEAFDRGHRVIGVAVDGKRLALVSSILRDSGAVEVEERAQSWRDQEAR
jgi:hypothetical protein